MTAESAVHFLMGFEVFLCAFRLSQVLCSPYMTYFICCLAYIFILCLGPLSAGMYGHCVCAPVPGAACGGQKMKVDPLGLELPRIRSQRVGAGN